MQSLLDLYNMREGRQPKSDLLEFYQGQGPKRQVVDRATFLPIGQYDDGSLTLAWPGFLKDAYDGGVRSLVAQEGSPIFDDGGQYVSGAEMQPLDAFNAASLGPVSGVAARAAGAIPRGALGSGGSDMLSKAKGIRAYHGSPHDFDKFDISKMGSGEGAQVYGHGLYFAEREGTAKWYRDNLAPSKGWGGSGEPVPHVDGRPVTLDEIPAYGHYRRNGHDLDKAIMAAQRQLDYATRESNRFAFRKEAKKTRDMYRAGLEREKGTVDLLNEWRSRQAQLGERFLDPSYDGHMYEVRINAEPDQFLNWDVLSAAQQGRLRTPEGASEMLAQGHPGIRYLDALSRRAGEGTHNYVLFDDSLVDITRKYANPDTAALPSLFSNAMQEEQPEGLLQFANADPRYDDPSVTYDPMQSQSFYTLHDRYAPWIGLPELDQQYWADPPEWRPRIDKPPRHRMIPLREDW